jgi:hypothetical protein
VLVLRTVGGAETVVEEVDTTAPFCEVREHHFDPGPVSEAAGVDECEDGTVIDVLAVYTPDAAFLAGGVAEIEAAIELAVAENNIAWTNSGLSREQNLVLAWQLDPIGAPAVSLDCLIDRDDGCLDQIHPLRDAVGADLVAFVEDHGSSVTYPLESLDPAHEAMAFALTPYSNFSNVVVSHELGHQMGCCHARGDGGGCGEGMLYPFSNGLRFVGDSSTEWRTVMAYHPRRAGAALFQSLDQLRRPPDRCAPDGTRLRRQRGHHRRLGPAGVQLPLSESMRRAGPGRPRYRLQRQRHTGLVRHRPGREQRLQRQRGSRRLRGLV